jgi:hypothetical protein
MIVFRHMSGQSSWNDELGSDGFEQDLARPGIDIWRTGR